jgi:hypothetical protein
LVFPFEGVTNCSFYVFVAKNVDSSHVVTLDLEVTHYP